MTFKIIVYHIFTKKIVKYLREKKKLRILSKLKSTMLLILFNKKNCSKRIIKIS